MKEQGYKKSNCQREKSKYIVKIMRQFLGAATSTAAKLKPFCKIWQDTVRTLMFL